MVSGLLGGSTRYPCNQCTCCRTTEQERMPITWSHYYVMAEKLINNYESDPKHAKDCYCFFSKPMIQFDDTNRNSSHTTWISRKTS